VFESVYERDQSMDWTHAAVVIRNEPSPSHPGLLQVIARSGDGREVIVDTLVDPGPDVVIPPGASATYTELWQWSVSDLEDFWASLR
jgi:hypothetical protein